MLKQLKVLRFEHLVFNSVDVGLEEVVPFGVDCSEYPLGLLAPQIAELELLDFLLDLPLDLIDIFVRLLLILVWVYPGLKVLDASFPVRQLWAEVWRLEALTLD